MDMVSERWGFTRSKDDVCAEWGWRRRPDNEGRQAHRAFRANAAATPPPAVTAPASVRVQQRGYGGGERRVRAKQKGSGR